MMPSVLCFIAHLVIWYMAFGKDEQAMSVLLTLLVQNLLFTLLSALVHTY